MDSHTTSKQETITKWILKIGDFEVEMRTINHTVKLGRYLMDYGVPVSVVKHIITLTYKDNGKAMMITKEEKVDCTHMLRQN